jgi:thiol-disulfide isomerase/thioredoxin
MNMKKIFLISVTLLLTNWCFCQTNLARVSGTVAYANDNDTVTLRIFKYGRFDTNNDYNDGIKVYKCVIKDHKFSFRVIKEVPRINEFSIEIPNMFGSVGDLSQMLIENGDNIKIEIDDKGSVSYSGHGSAKLLVKQHLSKSFRITSSLKMEKFSDFPKIVLECITLGKEAGRYINTQKNSVSIPAYKILQAYASGWYSGMVFSAPYYYFENANYQDSLQKVLSQYFRTYLRVVNNISDQTFLSVGFAPNLVIQNYALKKIIESGNSDALRGDLKGKYEFIKHNYKGLTREKLVTYLILSMPRSNDVGFCYFDAIHYIKNSDFRKLLDAHCQQNKGMPGFNFRLRDTNNIVHQLKEFRGKVVVLDFWFTGCGNCIHLTPKLAIVEKQFKENPNIVFLSISSDKDINMWKKSIKSGAYTTSDKEINLYTAGRGENDLFYRKINFQGAPTLRLIDKDGNWCENPVDCRDDDGKDLITKIEKALANKKP